MVGAVVQLPEQVGKDGRACGFDSAAVNEAGSAAGGGVGMRWSIHRHGCWLKKINVEDC